MKKLIPLMVGMAMTFGAATMFAGPQEKSTMKSTKKAPKTKKKSTAPKA